MKKLIVTVLLAGTLLAENPLQHADAEWLKKYHAATAEVRKADLLRSDKIKFRDDLLREKTIDCESRGQRLILDGLSEPSCQPKLKEPAVKIPEVPEAKK